MRHLITLAAVAALAGCSVDVEGAACSDDGNCPAGQRCGHDGTCSEAAAACPGPICQQNECSGQTLRTCVPDAQGVCATLSDSTCSAHQTCNATTGVCDCASGGCTAGVDSFCAPVGELVTCATEATTGCRFEASSSPCAVGETCGGAPTATCSCPAIGACTTAGDRSCNGDKLLECVPVEVGSLCNVWVEFEDCAISQLSCSPGTPAACTCPSPSQSPVVLHADPGAQTRPSLVRTGVLDPSICRYKAMSEALAAASSGAIVKAVGFAGTPVVFTEGPFTVPAGVEVTTDDATPTPANYVVEPSAAVATSTFISMKPGARLAGLTIRNTSASGVGVAIDCPGVGDTAPITLDSVHVIGEGTGTPAPRFSNGLRHGGNCSLVLTNSTVEGANDTGVLITDAAAATSLTMTGNLIHRNLANVTPYTIGASDRYGGGLVIFGATHPDTVTFQRNQLSSNAGDQILIFSPGTLDLSTAACGVDSNTITCYTAPGVGLSSRFGTVNVAHSYWQNDLPAVGIDFLAAAGATIAGATTLACGAASISCP